MLDMLNKDAIDVLLEAVNAKNTSLKTPLNKHNVTVSAVKELDPTANNGMDAEVTITAVANGPFTGALTFQYARADINTAYGRTPQVDITDLATVGQNFATGIETAPGAASLPLSSELTLNVATASENFSETSLPAYHADAAKSHIWKEGTAAIKIRSRILPPPAPQQMLKMKEYDLTAEFPTFPPMNAQWSYNNYMLAVVEKGVIYRTNAKTGAVVKSPISDAAGTDFAATTYKIFFLEESTTPVLLGADNKIYIFPDDIATADGATSTAVEMTIKSGSAVADGGLNAFDIPVFNYDMDSLTLINAAGTQYMYIDAGNNEYNITALSGDSLQAEDVFDYKHFAKHTNAVFYGVTRKGMIYSYDDDTGTLTYAQTTGGARDWFNLQATDNALYMLAYGGNDGTTCLVGVYDIKANTFNIKELPITHNNSACDDFRAVVDSTDQHIFVTHGTDTKCFVEKFKLSDMSSVEFIEVPHDKYLAFAGSYNNISQVMLGSVGKRLVSVDFSLDHELTGNA